MIKMIRCFNGIIILLLEKIEEINQISQQFYKKEEVILGRVRNRNGHI